MLLNRQGSFEKWFGLVILALSSIEQAQVVEHSRYDWMIRPKGLLLNRQGSFIEWFGLNIAALGAKDLGEII